MKLPLRSKLRSLLRSISRRALLWATSALPVQDAWQKQEHRVAAKWFGPGCIHDWPWFFEGESTVPVRSLDDVCQWLSGCEYAHDKALFNEADFWQHPITFETTRKGDCEDHSLWAWRKLTELGIPAEFVRGHYFDGRDLQRAAHIAVLFNQHGNEFFLDATAKGGRHKMLMTTTAARRIFCPEFSVDASFRTYQYAGRVLTLHRILRDEVSPAP